MPVELRFRKNKAFARAAVLKFFWSWCPFIILNIIENSNNRIVTLWTQIPYFMKNNYIFNKSEISIALQFFKSLYIWFNTRQMDPHLCFCIQPDVICYFGWSIRRKAISRRYVVGKEKGIVVAFSGDWGYSPLILHQNSVDLVAMWNLKPKQWKFCIHVALQMYSSILNFSWNFYLCLI